MLGEKKDIEKQRQKKIECNQKTKIFKFFTRSTTEIEIEEKLVETTEEVTAARENQLTDAGVWLVLHNFRLFAFDCSFVFVLVFARADRCAEQQQIASNMIKGAISAN